MSSPLPVAHRAQKLGPGLLTIGEVGSTLDMSAQLTAVSVTWENEEEEPLNVLSGEVIAGDDTYIATLEGTVVQDLTEDGVIDWTWKNKGQVVPITFSPTSGEAQVTGRVKVGPINLGGDVNVKNTSDVSWVFVGEPLFEPQPGSLE